MDQTITIRFRWTADELLQAHRYHFRHICRPILRLGLNFIIGFILFGGVLMLFTAGPSGKAPLPVIIGCLVLGSYWFVVRPFERRWWTRRQFSKRPDRDIEIEWQVGSEKIFAGSVLGQTEITWQAFAKVVCTPNGMMLYPIDQMYHWLPHHGFASDAEIERFVELAKTKIERHCYVD